MRDYEIKQIRANRLERRRATVETEAGFDHRRNRLGALPLLPKPVNASFRDDPYERRLEHYYAENRPATGDTHHLAVDVGRERLT